MARIQTNIGLITGIPIGDTVDQLIEVAARPRDMLVERTDELQGEQVAINSLAALLLSVQFVSNKLGSESLFDKRAVTSSNTDVLTATQTGQPPKGSYQFTPLRMVQSQQLLSSGFKTDTDPIGDGRLTFRFGDHVQRTARLECFGGGNGVVRGKICITDRSGATAEIDLSTVQTVDEVLEAVNGNNTINVTAVAHGDGLRLIDNTGQTASNLKVEEIAGGTTADSLGLAGIDVAASVADGQDMLWLYQDLELDMLNDGTGILVDPILSDIEYQLRDGTTGQIDLSPIESGGSNVIEETTLGEILDVINAAVPEKLQVQIAPDGDRLIITDLTEGAGTFQLQSLHDSNALADLGLDGQAVDGQITGRRIFGGAGTVLLSSLGGPTGLGPLGLLDLTDRSGTSDTVDLADAETLDEVIDAINAAGVEILAQVNQARNGIELVDTTGSTAGNLVVANGDGETATADKLGIAVDDNVTKVNSGDLHLQVIAHNTLLDNMNGGAGVALGMFSIFDTAGVSRELNLSEDTKTIGDVIRQINLLSLGVVAEINETGDGIRIRDTAHGSGTLQIIEGSSTAAKDLHLLGDVLEVEIAGQTTQVIDGTTTCIIDLDEDDSFEDLLTKINDLGAGVTASTFVDGSNKPYRLSLASDRAGKAGQLVLDTSGVDFQFQEIVRAQDAMLVFGDPGAAASSVCITSSSNDFTDVLSGISLQIKDASAEPVTITVSTTDTDLVASAKTLVQNYNSFREKLLELTAYDVETNTGSILTGDATALRLDTDLSYLLSGRFAGAGSIQSLGELGISLKADGTLDLDESQFKAAYAADPQAVKEFFTEEQFGVSARFGNLIEQIAGEEGSLLATRFETLNSKIQQNQERIDSMTEQLDRQREQLLTEFYRMETAISKMQSNLSVISAIQPISPLTSVSRVTV